MNLPKLDKRTYPEILTQALKLARKYFPEAGTIKWASIQEKTLDKDDPAYKLLEIFSKLMELLIRRLNRIPDKNFLSFLEMVGVEQKTGSPAEVPVTFLPAKSAVSGGDIPAGTQVATTQTDTADAQVFATRNAFYATAAKLKKVINLIPRKEKYSRLTLVDIPPREPGSIDNDTGKITAFKEDDESLQDIDHVLYIGSESLFGGKETIKLELEISLSNGNKELFNETNLKWKTYNKEKKEWQKIDNTTVSYDYTVPNTVKIAIDPFIGTAPVEVNGVEAFWIACRFAGVFTSGMPVVEEIKGKILATVVGSTVAPKIDSAFSNSTPVDPSKTIYPFGQRPQYGDAFYIGSKQAFTPEIQEVTLNLKIHPYSTEYLKEKIYKGLEKVTDGTDTVNTKIQWEYLDENEEWQTLETFSHSFTASKSGAVVDINRHRGSDINGTFFGDGDSADIKITLSGFDNIALNKVNKVESYWLRAVIKTFDPYGKDAWIESTTVRNKPFVVIGPTFIPPIIESMDISYTYKAASIPVDSIQTKNNFEFKIQKEKSHESYQAFTPFIPITSYSIENADDFFGDKPALYLGFDKEFGDVFISMFFHITEALSAAGYALETGNPHITWEYAAANYTWRPLDIKDNTANLTTSGTAAFTGPSDSIKILLFKTLFQEEEAPEQELYWYRARLAKGSYDFPPCIKGIYLNTVMADNRVESRQDLVVGSGNGTANQKLSLVRVPVLGGQLWVREVEKPGEDELKNHLSDFRTLTTYHEIEEYDLIEERDTGIGVEENWVQWLKVPNFLASGPRSRHYTLDAVNGIITCGDNKNGLIPPAGKDNLMIRNYTTGGGEKANSAASPLAVKELKGSLPYIDKIFNVQNAVGGSNPWSLEQTKSFGPQSIKNRGRAVNVEDYEWMVLQQFSAVARVKCIPTSKPGTDDTLSHQPGAVTLIIVSQSTRPKPLPSKGLLRNIRDYLKQKTLGNIAAYDDIHVIGPNFKEIKISAVVVPDKPEESSMVERRIIKALEDFFHPLTGGEQKKGWNFGRDVFISEIYAVIERTPGVKYVKKAWFTDDETQEDKFIKIDSNSLVYSGTHDIRMEMS